MVNPAGSSGSRYAPVNEQARAGLVKYLTDGASFVVNKRRESAYKQMYESCGGPYRIVAEGQRVEGGVVVSNTTASRTTVQASPSGATVRESGRTTDVTADGKSQTVSASSETHYWYINYKCATKSDTATTVR
jgi:hypothetical protein